MRILFCRLFGKKTRHNLILTVPSARTDSDVDADVLADYVLALLRHDGDASSVQKLCVTELDDFLKDGSSFCPFVLFALSCLSANSPQKQHPLSATSSRPYPTSPTAQALAHHRHRHHLCQRRSRSRACHNHTHYRPHRGRSLRAQHQALSRAMLHQGPGGPRRRWDMVPAAVCRRQRESHTTASRENEPTTIRHFTTRQRLMRLVEGQSSKRGAAVLFAVAEDQGQGAAGYQQHTLPAAL